MTRLTAYVQGIGVLGPGLSDWAAARGILRGDNGYQNSKTLLPAPEVLPPAERRRAGRIIKLALAVGTQAVTQAQLEARCLPSVFSSAGGDGDNCQEICTTLASSERQISPTRFHNSVHNAAAGYWSIAHGCTDPSTSLCANDASFGAGLLEALTQLGCGQPSVLLVAYDIDYPPPLRAQRPIPDAFGVALVLTSTASRSLARLTLELCNEPCTPMADAPLEQLRRAIPAARCLPLLQCIAQGRSARVVLDYLSGSRLGTAVQC